MRKPIWRNVVAGLKSVRNFFAQPQTANLLAAVAVIIASLQAYLSWRSMAQFKQSEIYQRRLEACSTALSRTDAFLADYSNWRTSGLSKQTPAIQAELLASSNQSYRMAREALTQFEILGPESNADVVYNMETALAPLVGGVGKFPPESDDRLKDTAQHRDALYGACVSLVMSSPNAETL